VGQARDPEARFYLTANAAFWLAVHVLVLFLGLCGPWFLPRSLASWFSEAAGLDPPLRHPADPGRAGYHGDDTGAWPGFLVSGWLAAAVLHRTEWFYESARIQFALTDRVATMTAADVAWMLAALRRVGAGTDESLLAAARGRLDATQRSDGAWPSDDAPAFDVHTTLTALRAAP
jgi:hypothetical protein